MNILKKKNLLKNKNNYLNTHKIFLKNLNYINNFKKRNNILLRDTIILKLDNLYLLNINLKDNFFFSNINKNLYKNNLVYFFNFYNNYLKKMEINLEYSNYIYNKFYFNFLNNKLKKFYVHKFSIKRNNKLKKYYITDFNLCHNVLKTFIIGPLKKKIQISFLGKIFNVSYKILDLKPIDIKQIKNKYLKKHLKHRYSFINQFNFFFYQKHIVCSSKILCKENKLNFYFYSVKNVIDEKKISLNKNKKNLKKFNKIFFLSNLINLKKKY